MVLVYLFRIYVCESIALCLPNLDLAIYVLHLTGVAFVIVSFVYYGEVTQRAVRGLYNTNITQKMRAIGACFLFFFSVPLDIGHVPNFERLTVCVLRTYTVPPRPLFKASIWDSSTRGPK